MKNGSIYTLPDHIMSDLRAMAEKLREESKARREYWECVAQKTNAKWAAR